METKDLLLAEQSRLGDSNSFTQLYGKYAVELYRFALYMTGNTQDAEDAVQDAVLSAWKNIDSLKDNTLFKAWLFKILANRCKTLLMRRNKQPDALPVEEYDFLRDYSADSLISSVEIKDALSKLTPPDGQIVLLSIIGGFKSHELAHIYNMPPATVRTHQKRALEKLREILS